MHSIANYKIFFFNYLYSYMMRIYATFKIPAVEKKVLYVQEEVTLQKKYLIYLHKKMRFTTFFNYYNTLG